MAAVSVRIGTGNPRDERTMPGHIEAHRMPEEIIPVVMLRAASRGRASWYGAVADGSILSGGTNRTNHREPLAHNQLARYSQGDGVARKKETELRVRMYAEG